MIDISGAKFNSKHAQISLKNDEITIQNGHIQNNIFDANFSAFIDTNSKIANFDTKFNSFIIPNLIDVKNLDDNITLNFANDAIISSDALGYDVNLSQPISINIPKIDNIKPYSKLINDLNITKANIKATTDDFDKFSTRATNLNFNLPIINRKNDSYTDDNFTIKIDDIIDIKSDSGVINATIINDEINIFLNSAKISINSNSAKSNLETNINFIGTDTIISATDTNKTISFEHFSGRKNQNELKFDGEFDGGYISIVDLEVAICSVFYILLIT